VEDINYVVMCAGSFDILVELVCEDDDTILDRLNGVIRRIPGVRDTETFMYLKLTKQTYTWGTR
jgi:Lrp/AsnC family transcriptional regulator for asnA, asnC and gidA